MESTCVDTSLNLNVSPSGHMDVVAVEVLVEELHRLSSENKRLTERLARMSESYSALQKHLSQVLKNTNSETDLSTTQISKKRKAEIANCVMNNMFGFSGASECSTSTEEESFKRPKDHSHSSPTPPKVSKVLVRTEASDPSLYVRDGYQWRKYGQKVTRDNPSPRAYFRCSHAPSCSVKKKVQRSVEDPTVLVATYEGEHNHANRTEISVGSSQVEVVGSAAGESCMKYGSRGDRARLDLVQRSGLVDNIQQFLVQQMASALTRDPNFISSLASAISGTISDPSIPEK